MEINIIETDPVLNQKIELPPLSKKLQELKKNNVRARYFKHYLEQDNFIIEAMTPNLVQIVIKRSDAVDLLCDLQRYLFQGFITDDLDT